LYTKYNYNCLSSTMTTIDIETGRFYKYEDLINKIDYIEKDYANNLKKALKYLDPNGSDSFANWNQIHYIKKKYGDNCVCSHDIVDQFYVQHNTTLDRVLIGSHCVGGFSTGHKKRVNQLLRMNRDPTAIYCGLCSKKTQGAKYHTSCLQRVAKQCWQCSLFEGYGCECPRCESCRNVINSLETKTTHCYRCHQTVSITTHIKPSPTAPPSSPTLSNGLPKFKPILIPTHQPERRQTVSITTQPERRQTVSITTHQPKNPQCESCCVVLKSTEPWKTHCYGCYLDKQREDKKMDDECARDIAWYRLTIGTKPNGHRQPNAPIQRPT
jgi:hypothetical protein